MASKHQQLCDEVVQQPEFQTNGRTDGRRHEIGVPCLHIFAPLKIPAESNENPTYSIAAAVAGASEGHFPSASSDVLTPLAHRIAAMYALANRASP
jgi:hypothetical protein